MTNLKLNYWALHGLGGQIRFLLEYANANYEDNQITMDKAEEWFATKETLGLAYPNLPWLSDGDVKICESMAIMKYLGRKFQLAPTSENERILADQTEGFLIDLRTKLARVAYDKDTYEKSKAEFLELAPKKLSYLNDLLGKNEYVVGSKMTYVDVIVYDVLMFISKFEPKLVSEQANLVRFVEKIEKIPRLAAYLQTYRTKKMTMFGPYATWNAEF